MLITHKINWDRCLSHQIWPAIEKGWTDEDRKIHFFWGLAGKNQQEIEKCIENKEEWWYVDVGYFTEPITRYPEPKIHNKDRTYFRIVKGDLHTRRFTAGRKIGDRLRKLEDNKLDVRFKGWSPGQHILICPSSPTVTMRVNKMTQEEWVEAVKEELIKYTDREIRVRNKPRPDNQWWNTDIKDDLKDCHCLVTNMSLASIDAILNYVPVIADGGNVAWPVSSRDPKFIEKPMKPGRKTIEEWLKFIAEHQFTLSEIEDGTAYRTLMYQYE